MRPGRATRAKLVVKAAKSAQRVVRLMDGDAATFNGLAEEAVACLKADVPFEIVPGVSAISAVPAYAGVPLTDAKTRAVHVIHPAQAGVDVSGATDADVTAVLLGTPDGVVAALAALLDAGRDPQTPGRRHRAGHDGRAAHGRRAARRARPRRPGPRGLSQAAHGGRRDDGGPARAAVLVRDQAAVRLADPGAAHPRAGRLDDRPAGRVRRRLSVVPTISVESPRTPQQMERAIKGMVTGRYEWVGFTSVNAVKAVRERFEEFGLDARAFSGLKVAAVGGVTADALREWGIQPDLVPSGEQSAHGLLEDWPPYDDVLDPINRVFLPRADIATDTLVAGPAGHRLGGRRRHGLPHGACRAAGPGGARRDQVRPVRRGRLHVELDRAQPGRHRRQAAPVDRRRVHRSGHGQDGRGARPARRRPGRRGERGRAGAWRWRSTAPGCAGRPPRPGEPVLRPSQRKGATRRKAK